MATAKKTAAGNWCIQVYIGKDASGKKKLKRFYGNTKKEAELNAAQFLTKKQRDEDPMNKSVEKAIEDYISDYCEELSPSTRRGYNSIKRNLPPDFLQLPVASVDFETMQKAMNTYAKHRAKKTVKNAKQLLSPSLRYAKCFINTKQIATSGKEKKALYIPSHEEVLAVWDQVRGTSYEIPFALAAFLGMRRGEIAALTWDDIDFKRKTITVQHAVAWNDEEHAWNDKAPKSYDGTRVIPMFGATYDLLLEQYNAGQPVCKVKAGTITVKFPNFLKKANVHQFRFHDLRHYFASSMLALNIPNKYIADIIGHKDETMLQRVYQHIMDDKKKEVYDKINDFHAQNFVDRKKNNEQSSQ